VDLGKIGILSFFMYEKKTPNSKFEHHKIITQKHKYDKITRHILLTVLQVTNKCMLFTKLNLIVVKLCMHDVLLDEFFL
jgi:hypothetical protein